MVGWPGYTDGQSHRLSRRYGRHLQRPRTSPGAIPERNWWWLVLAMLLSSIVSTLIVLAMGTLAGAKRIVRLFTRV